jgi:quercetin 2,3-dioxygenase
VIRPGDVQRMSAGTGVRHSEYNPSESQTTHFLQIWIEPERNGIDPGYEEAHFSEAEKRGRLRLIAAPNGGAGSVTIHQDARIYAALIDGAEAAALAIAPGRRVYVHVARGAVRVNGEALRSGDAVQLTDVAELRLSQGRAAEVLVFDLP